MSQELLRPRALRPGDTIGVFTPSSPAYVANEGLFANGLENIRRLGFRVQLGALTEKRASQGYRSGTAEERAAELMDLVRDPQVHGLISTIGGNNSSSLIPHLDFARIRHERKLLCGFSDVTSLHLAFLHYAGLAGIYGPSVMCWFGDWPDGVVESTEWFLEAAQLHRKGRREVATPKRWSNHKRAWNNGEWKNVPREWRENEGWRTLSAGSAQAPILALNLNTLLTAAGTPYWPSLGGKILLLEDMDAPLSRTERSLQQLKLLGAFEGLAGLIFGKPEFYHQEGAPFGYEQLIQEVVGPRPYPVVANFDCGHCVPMISVPQLSRAELRAGEEVAFAFLEGAIS